MPTANTAEADTLVPDPQVCQEFGISLMGLWRWSRDPNLDFPPAINIRGRNYRSRRALECFKERMVRQAIRGRGQRRAQRPHIID
jgi:hypothetical protein